MPFVFTEQGVAMLSAVLKSEKAIKASIQIMKAFVSMRRFLLNNAQIFSEIDSIKRHQIESDKKIEELFDKMDKYKIEEKQGIFFQGQIFDAYAKFESFIQSAKKEIVLIDGYLGYWVYQDLLANGAVGIVTHDGHVNYTDRDIDTRELRSYVHQGNKLPAVHINTKDAVALVNKGIQQAKITLKQREYTGSSQNVILDMPGETDEYIVFTAHYDSTSLSQGAYDNMSGSVGLLGIAAHFKDDPHRYGLRFVWCGCEERGLLGSKAYCAAHEQELGKVVLNINLDMIGCTMGKFIACATAEEKLVNYVEYFSLEQGFAMKAYQDVYSSDSTPFADKGVPAISFARRAPANTATIHNRYDTMALISGEQMAADIDFLIRFANRMANARCCPVGRQIPDNMKEKLDIYLNRKRPNS